MLLLFVWVWVCLEFFVCFRYVWFCFGGFLGGGDHCCCFACWGFFCFVPCINFLQFCYGEII